MKIYYKTITESFLILISPTVTWLGVTKLGYGPQSLANLIELPVVWVCSLLLVFIPKKILAPHYKILIGLLAAILLRTFMPLIPE